MSRHTIAAAALAAICSLTLCRAAPPWQLDHHIDSLLEPLGLANRSVFHIAFDKDGNGAIRYVWLASSNGLYRYDGYHHRVFSSKDGLPSDFVRSVVVTRDGTLWIATNKGAGTFDGSTFSSQGSEQGLAGPNVRRIIEDRQGTLWFASDKWGPPNSRAGLASYRDGKWRAWHVSDGLPSDYVVDEFTDSSGRVFAMTLQGPAQLVGNRWIREPFGALSPASNWGGGVIAEAPGLGLVISDGQNVWASPQGTWVKLGDPPRLPHAMVVTRDGKVLIAGVTNPRRRALFEWNGKDWVRVSNDFHVSVDQDNFLEEAPDGAIWYAGVDCLERWPRLSSEWRFLPGPESTRYLFDADQHIWASGESGLLSEFDGKGWIQRGRYTAFTGPPADSVWAIKPGSVSRWRQGREIVFTAAETGVSSGQAIDVDGKGTVWLTGFRRDGAPVASNFDGRQWHPQVLPERAGFTRFAHSGSPDGGIWYLLDGAGSTPKLLYVREPADVETFDVPQALMPSFSNFIEARAGKTVYLYGETGLHKFQPGHDWQSLPGLVGKHVTAVQFRDGETWAGTSSSLYGNSGLYRISDAGGFTMYPTDLLNGLGKGADGSLMAGAAGKVYVIPPGKESSPFEIPLPDQQAIAEAVFVDGEGALWIGTGNSVARFARSQLSRDIEVGTNGEEILPGQTFTAVVRAIRRFDPSANPPGLTFSARLDGGPWTAFGSKFHYQYEKVKLRTGPHIFEVRARDNGFELAAPVEARFNVHSPPLQDQPWFVPSLVLVTTLMAFSSVMAIWARLKVSAQAKAMIGMSEQRYKQIVESAQEGIATIDDNGICTMLNTEFANILGRPEEQILNRHYREWVAENLAGEADRLFERKRQGLVDRYEVEVKTPLGVRVVAVCERPVPTTAGAFVGYLLTITDLTASRQAEDAIRRSEANYRALFASSPNARLLVDRETLQILKFNDAACETYGYSPEEFSRITILDLQVAGRADESRRLFAAPVFPGPIVRQHRKKDGTAIDVEVYTHDQEVDGKRCRQVLTIDKTAQLIAENNLRESQQSLALAQEITKMGSFRARFGDSPGETVTSEWSDELYRVLGLDPNNPPFPEPILADFLYPDDRHAALEHRARLVREGIACDLEHRIIRADGVTRFVRTVARRSEIGVDQLIGTVQDITEYKALQGQLEQSQRLDSVGRLAGGVAHDFNNLLTVINGYSKLILNRLEPGTRLFQDVQQIAEAGNQAAVLTKRLLAFGMKQTLKPITVDLNQVVSEVATLLRHVVGEDISLITHLSGQPLWVQADPVQMNQVLLNLTTNARDAMPQGGTLAIEVSAVVLDEPFVTTHPDAAVGPHVRLMVSDTGAGMDVETQRRIFEPFFTTKDRTGGTGLGLATLYGIIKQTGGSIQVESRIGHGTTFQIHLPSVPGVDLTSDPMETESSHRAVQKGDNRLVLLVEDQGEVRRYAAGILIEQGFRVMQASNGKEALSIVGDLERGVDLLLTDVVMPGMTGFELVRRIGIEHAAKRPKEILYMTGYADGKLDAAGAPTSGLLLLEKPFSPEDLLGHLEKAFLRGSREADGSHAT